MKKTLLILPICVALVGCSSNEKTVENETKMIETESENVSDTITSISEKAEISITDNELPSTSEYFPYDYSNEILKEHAFTVLKLIQNNDYEGIFNCLNIGENPVITAKIFEEEVKKEYDDFIYDENYEPESSLYKLMGQECYIESYFEDSQGNASVTYAIPDQEVIEYGYFPKTTYTMKISDNNGSPLIDEEGEYYESNVILQTTGDAEIIVNGITLDKSQAKPIENDNPYDARDTYLISIPSDDLFNSTAKIKTENYGECEVQIKFSDVSESEQLLYNAVGVLPEELEESELEKVRILFDNILKLMLENYNAGNDDLSAYTEFMADGYQEEGLKDVFDYFKSSITGKTIDINVSKVIKNPDDKIFILDDNTICFNIGYELNYSNINPLSDEVEPVRSSKYSSVYLKRQDDGSYKFLAFPDIKLFLFGSFIQDF